MKRHLAFALTAAVVALPCHALAWGNEGHEVVALIARSYLAPAVLARVDQLLAEDGDTLTGRDMASRATWADRWREANRASAPWHYTDLELSRPDLEAACARRSCAAEKVDQFARELASPRTSEAERIFALKMVLHLVGDLHQPLHSATAYAGGRNDAGGNCERVVVPGFLGVSRPMSLHAYWDDATVEALGRDPSSVAAKLRRQISPAQVRAWSQGSPAAWTMEAYGLADQVAYRFGGPARCGGYTVPLSGDYQARAQQTAALQLQRAGVRLATILNRSIGTGLSER
jgi:hypothetical protein